MCFVPACLCAFDPIKLWGLGCGRRPALREAWFPPVILTTFVDLGVLFCFFTFEVNLYVSYSGFRCSPFTFGEPRTPKGCVSASSALLVLEWFVRLLLIFVVIAYYDNTMFYKVSVSFLERLSV